MLVLKNVLQLWNLILESEYCQIIYSIFFIAAFADSATTRILFEKNNGGKQQVKH